MRSKTVLRVVSKALIPFILLFALYTQFHGDFGPGGGFQAGVILAAAVVLYGLIFGLDAVRDVVSDRAIEVLAASGVLLYAGVGVVCMLLGGDFLDYDVLTWDGPVMPEAHAAGGEHGGDHGDGGHHGLLPQGQHLGILLVELGVGMTVSAVMIAIFGAFTGRARAQE